ncbi:MAG: MFS transporter [Chloroflexi bacterium]|nr:MFS transporter [Chloroflexota bacterium]
MKTSLSLQIILFTFIRMVSSTAYRMVYPFLPAFRDGLNVPLETLAPAIGSRSLVAAIFAPLLSSVGDSRGRKQGMLLGLAIFIAGTAIAVFWPTFPGFILALMFTTVGKVTFDPTMQAYLGDRVPYERRSFAITITELSWSGAYIVGIPLVGWVIAGAGWLAPFPLLGALILLAALLLGFQLPKDEPRAVKPPSLWVNFGTILHSRPAIAAMGLTVFSVIANEFINLTFGVWMEESFGLQLVALGGAAAVLGIAELSGEGLVALITDRLGKRRAIFFGLVINSLAVISLPIVGGTLVGALMGLFMFYISFEFFIVSSIPLMTEVLPAARATMMAGFFTSASIGRAVAGWIALDIYALGFMATVVATVAFNLLAILSIRNLRIAAEEGLRG